MRLRNLQAIIQNFGFIQICLSLQGSLHNLSVLHQQLLFSTRHFAKCWDLQSTFCLPGSFANAMHICSLTCTLQNLNLPIQIWPTGYFKKLMIFIDICFLSSSQITKPLGYSNVFFTQIYFCLKLGCQHILAFRFKSGDTVCYSCWQETNVISSVTTATPLLQCSSCNTVKLKSMFML